MPYSEYLTKYRPSCSICGCVITRIGEICQTCCYKYNIECDECTCHDDPTTCTSKLDHYCCCLDRENISECRAERIEHYSKSDEDEESE